ncbi:hypothetical protein Pmani_018507 [Petrolisthes manimaculis]|uniref:Kazal-like domain-containing protein n=1 Tax=Petrolisthes manimaculis TaxID=1843537 RepID=A0AAE1PMK3_9EUCA|nr:hypothetical protein Pmani_018507 [Petrolisthes manimaculis]
MVDGGRVCGLVLVLVLMLVSLVQGYTVLGPSSDTHPECNRVCEHDQSPLCGDNGKLYTNQCFLDYDNCVAGGGIRVKYSVDCRMTTEAALGVMIDVAPVCASNNVTHPNFCSYERERCKDPSIGFRHDGVCGGEPRPDCSRRCKKEWTQVCASDGNVYNGNCTLSYYQCIKPQIAFLYNVPCPYSGLNDYAAVCGSDGRFYRNYCSLLKFQCRNPDIKLAPVEKCRSPSADTPWMQGDTEEGTDQMLDEGQEQGDNRNQPIPLEPGLPDGLEHEHGPPDFNPEIQPGPPFVSDNQPGPPYVTDYQPGPPYVTDNQPGPPYVTDNQPGPPYVTDNQSGPPYVTDNRPGPPYVTDNQPGPPYVTDNQPGPPFVTDNQPGPSYVPDNGPGGSPSFP